MSQIANALVFYTEYSKTVQVNDNFIYFNTGNSKKVQRDYKNIEKTQSKIFHLKFTLTCIYLFSFTKYINYNTHLKKKKCSTNRQNRKLAVRVKYWNVLVILA